MEKNSEILFQNGCELANNNNFKKAIPFFEKAAELGHDGAMASLAVIYIEGHGVKQNINKGLEYLQICIDNGDPYSINYLGTLYLNGTEIPQNYDKAFYYFSIAAEDNFPYAILNLAKCYEHGYGTKIDTDEAINCYLSILNEEFADEIENQAECEIKKYENNPAVLYCLSQIYVSKKPNQAKYAELIEKSAKGGYPPAQYEIGKLLEVGIGGFEKDVYKSIEWIEKAAQQGHKDAIYTLQYMNNPNFFNHDKTKVNKTKYKYKNKILFRKYLALEIIKDFVIEHPESTLESLNKIFTVKNEWGFDFEFVYLFSEPITKQNKYDNDFNNSIKLKNGEVIGVKMCSDFTIMSRFKDIALQNGFDIEEV